MNYIGTDANGATFSPDRRHRYTLWRWWSDGPPDLSRMVAFIGLNPSTADEQANDPTVTRCINFAKSWGHDGIVMLNLFAYRATDPREMKRVNNPIGPLNNSAIGFVTSRAALVVCCWGCHGSHLDRGKIVSRWLADECELHTFGLTKGGQPKHPLYLPGNARLQAVSLTT